MTGSPATRTSRAPVRLGAVENESMAAGQQSWAGDEIPPGTEVIQVHVAELSQLFNSIDPSPFHDKDLDDDAEEFIVSWAKEIGPEKPFALLVYLDKPAVMPDAGSVVREAVRGFFARRSSLTRRRLRDLFRTGRKSLVIGLAFLAGSVAGGNWVVQALSQSSVAQLIRESLLIGGWVAMWRPLEIFLYAWWPIRNEQRIYDRLAGMPVRIECVSAGDGNERAVPADAVTSPARAGAS